MKPFTTIDQQIKILKDRNLKFLNEKAAREHLRSFGYYEIVNGYKDYLLEATNPDKYFEDATFEQLFSIYEMDRKLQQSVLNATLEFEIMLKSAMSYVIAETFTSDQDKYLIKSNYKSGKIHTRKDGSKYWDIDSSFIKFHKIINDNVEPFQHYRMHHKNTPPWILFKGATLGNMMHFYKLQKAELKNRIISIMLDLPLEVVEINVVNEAVKDLFSDVLTLCFKFRNRSAHSGRVYNYRPDKSNIRYNDLLHKRMGIDPANYRLGLGKNDLYTLIFGLSVLGNSSACIKLSVGSRLAIATHLSNYKNDKYKILESIGVPSFDFDLKIEDIFNKPLYIIEK